MASLANQFCAIVTPLQVEAWAVALSGHPDRAFVKYLLDGICHGFRIGYNDDPSRMRRSAKHNMLSAKQNPQVVSDYLKREREAGQVVGPIPSEEVVRVGVHINCFGVIPKSGQPGKWRLMVDLSHPSGESINDGWIQLYAPCPTRQSTQQQG